MRPAVSSPGGPALRFPALLVVLLLSLLAATPAGATCAPATTALCLAGGRFRAEVAWEDFQGGRGPGHAVTLTGDTGAFWFFGPENLELVVKVLDGRPINGHFWVFYASLSNVRYTLTVTDTASGAVRTYENPSGHFASRGDTGAFAGSASPVATGNAALPALPALPAPPATAARPAASGAGSDVPVACQPGATALCLAGGRFRVEVTWEDFQGGSGPGHAVSLTGDTGAFWFFGPENLELVVKVLDGRPINGHFWVFYGALSNVEYRMTVTDTATGRRRTFHNPAGRFASVGDVEALSGAPLLGVAFSPRYFASIDRPWTAKDNVAEFFSELEQHGWGTWAINREWYEVGEDGRALIDGYDDLLADVPGLSRRLVLALQFADPSTGLPRGPAGWEPTWESWNAHGGWSAFTAVARRVAARYRPPFLSVGVEINAFARNFPAELERFARQEYPAIAEVVGEVSPDTVVFPGFQFEQMMGDLHGIAGPNGELGCAGCVPLDRINSLSGRTYPDMSEVLNLFPAPVLTHVGFTTYPYFDRDFRTPADVPDDYYTRLYQHLDAAHQGVRLVFTETGWPANAELSPGEACLLCARQHPEAHPVCFPQVVPDGACTAGAIQTNVDFFRDWLGGEAEQAAWVRRFEELTAPLGSPLAVWLLLHDADPRQPASLDGLFTHLGLEDHDGSVVRPAFAAWASRDGGD